VNSWFTFFLQISDWQHEEANGVMINVVKKVRGRLGKSWGIKNKGRLGFFKIMREDGV
jgi:hypothetical protein